jgi:hypothetical protein
LPINGVLAFRFLACAENDQSLRHDVPQSKNCGHREVYESLFEFLTVDNPFREERMIGFHMDDEQGGH